MTVYHVWLTGHDEPEVVQAHEVTERDGHLWFMTSMPVLGESGTIRFDMREFKPEDWHKWAVVQDDADTIHL